MKKFPAVALFALAVLFLVSGVKAGGNALIGGAALAALLVFLGFRKLKTKEGKAAKAVKTIKEQPRQSAAPVRSQPPAAAPVAPRPAYQFVNFKVAGTSFSNDDGKDRQTILRHIKFRDAPYVEGDVVDVQIVPYEYNGSPAYKCLVNGYMIGNVPRDSVQEVAEALRHEDAMVTGFQVTGGGKRNGEQLNYGCEIAIRYTPALQNN